MRSVLSISKSTSTWWWVFGLLIAVPALILAFQGLRAVRADRIESEQQVRRQQQQVARLMDGAIVTMLSSLENELRRGVGDKPEMESSAAPVWADVPVFSLGRHGIIVFPRERLYFGGFGARPASVTTFSEWPNSTRQLIEEAQAAEVQGHSQEAVTRYRQVSRDEPLLRDWAELGIARVREGTGLSAVLQPSSIGSADYAEGLTPSGLPVALLAATEIERMPRPERFRYLPLLERLLSDLHRGSWWFSYEERRFYDATLRRIIDSLDTGHATPRDVVLDQLAMIHLVVRQSPPYVRDRVSRAFVRMDEGSYLVVWEPSEEDPETWIGTALSREALQRHLDATLIPLLSDQPYQIDIRDALETTIWGSLPAGAPILQRVGSQGVREWEYAFGISTALVGRGPRLLWHGFLALLIVMLSAGVAMTIRVVNRELELGRLQSDFVAAVSHEFKSPITGVRLLVERLSGGRTGSPEQSEAYFKAIDGELTRLERLVNRLLVMQQVQADRRPYHFVPASVADLARQAVDLQRPQASAKSISLTLEADEPTPVISVDEAAVLDTFENLLDNAVKYSPSHTGVVMSIRSTGDSIVVDVRDEGIGIDPKEQERIFDKFYRAKGADGLDVRGTGLGLALVKNVVEAHHGTLSVESVPGEGSCFTLRFPIHDSGG